MDGKSEETQEIKEKETNKSKTKAKKAKDTAPSTEKTVELVEEEITSKAKKHDELMDKYLRTLAEFDNFKKRTDKEKGGMYQNGVCDTVISLLPVFDNFERALNSVEDKENSFYKGIDMIFKQFHEVLSGLGVEKIEAVGQQFNHNLHSAVAHIKDENIGENIVVDEMLKGYKLKDKIIRHSIVRVAN